MVERCSTFDFRYDDEKPIIEITSADYHRDFKQGFGAGRNRDKDTYFVKGYGNADIRTPQERTLDWIISSLVRKKAVMALIKFCMYDFDQSMDDMGGNLIIEVPYFRR